MFIFQIVEFLFKKTYLNKITMPNGGSMDYIQFGQRGPHLLIILGLGDSIRTVKDIAILLYLYFLPYAVKNRIIIMSRRRVLPKNCSILDMAEDYAYAMNKLEIKEFYIWGSSAGGPIAQILALKEADKVKGLILSKTFGKSNALFNEVVMRYIEEFKMKKFTQLIKSFVSFDIKEKRLELLNKLLSKVSRLLTKKYGENRVLIFLQSLLIVNQLDSNETLKCPVLIFVEQNDSFVPTKMQNELGNSFSESIIITINNKREGHFITVKSYFRYVRAISNFIRVNEKVPHHKVSENNSTQYIRKVEQIR